MKNNRWRSILLDGVVAEFAFFIVIPLSLLAGQKSLRYSEPPESSVLEPYGCNDDGLRVTTRVKHEAPGND